MLALLRHISLTERILVFLLTEHAARQRGDQRAGDFFAFRKRGL